MHYKPVSRLHCSSIPINAIAGARLYYFTRFSRNDAYHRSRAYDRNYGRSSHCHDSEQGRCQYGNCASWRVSCCCAWYYSILVRLWYCIGKSYSALLADTRRDDEADSKFVLSRVRPLVSGSMNHAVDMATSRYHLIQEKFIFFRFTCC